MKFGCLVAMLPVLAIPVVAVAAGLRVNTTESMPVGLYQQHGFTALNRGDSAVTCVPKTELNMRYIGPGSCSNGMEPLLKTVGAVFGDTVKVGAWGISVNGIQLPNTAALPTDRAGRQLPAMPYGTYPVHQGEVYLISSHSPDCFDSRYFGPVATSEVIAIATPVWVFD